MKTTDAKYLDCMVLDSFVQEVLGRTYGTLQSGNAGYSQDSMVSFDTENQYTEPEEGIEEVEAWLKTERPDPEDWSAVYREAMPSVDSMMTYLHSKGHIEPGFYVIHMWW